MGNFSYIKGMTDKYNDMFPVGFRCLDKTYGSYDDDGTQYWLIGLVAVIIFFILAILFMLTILSTVLGMIPFLIDGHNDQPFWLSLAVGTIGGLALSVIPIFLFLPVVIRLDGYLSGEKSSVLT